MEQNNHDPNYSRRIVLKAGAALGSLVALSLAPLSSVQAAASGDKKHDMAILNAALDLEHQAIWAYGAAAGKLTGTAVGNTIKALALRNQADHMKHRDIFISTIKGLGATPVETQESYDLSAYIRAGEGGLDSDANIAKLALALEVDAVLAYASAVSKLRSPDLVAAGLTILPDESAHATAIRAVFNTLDTSIHAVPSAQLSTATRKDWILSV